MKGDSSSFMTVIDIENLENFLENNPEHSWVSCNSTDKREPPITISKVPQHICWANESAYGPVVVSIGPYYHGKPSLQKMEKRKWTCLEFLLQANPVKSLDDYLKGIWEICPSARSYYRDDIEMTSGKFAQMLLLDGCFILMTLHKIDRIPYNPHLILDDNSLLSRWQYHFLRNDLFLVENQIPFTVVKRVYELIIGEENATAPLEDEITNFVVRKLSNIPIARKPRNFHHLLHMVYLYLKPSRNYGIIELQAHHDNLSLHQLHSATEYHIAGLKFIKRELENSKPHSLLDVRVSEDVLELSYLPADENIASIFANVIEFERMNPRFGNDITAYIIFMSKLISDAEDVNLLASNGILEHHFESDEDVVRMFMELSSGAEFDYAGNCYLKNVCHDLEGFYDGRTKWWKGWLE